MENRYDSTTIDWERNADRPLLDGSLRIFWRPEGYEGSAQPREHSEALSRSGSPRVVCNGRNHKGGIEGAFPHYIQVPPEWSAMMDKRFSMVGDHVGGVQAVEVNFCLLSRYRGAFVGSLIGA